MKNAVRESALVLVNKGMDGLIVSMALCDTKEYVLQSTFLTDALSDMREAVVVNGIAKEEFAIHASNAILRLKEMGVIKNVIRENPKEWEEELINVCYEQMKKYVPNDVTTIDIDAIFSLINKTSIEVSNGLPSYHVMTFLCVKSNHLPVVSESRLSLIKNILLKNIDKIDTKRINGFILDIKEWANRVSDKLALDPIQKGLHSLANAIQAKTRNNLN